MRIIIRVNKNFPKNEKLLKLLDELSSPKMVNFPQNPLGFECKEESVIEELPNFIKERFTIGTSLTDEKWEELISEKQKQFINQEIFKREARKAN